MLSRKELQSMLLRYEVAKTAPIEHVCQGLQISYHPTRHIRCPLPQHPNDDTPSCLFYPNNTFGCFGCRGGGSTIDLVATIKKIPPTPAVIWIETHILKQRHTTTYSTHHLTQNLKRIRSTFLKRRTQDNFDCSQFKQNLMDLIIRKQTDLLRSSTPTSTTVVEHTLNTIYQHIDAELTQDSPRSTCETVLVFVKFRLQTLEDIVNELQLVPVDSGGTSDS